MIRPANEGIDVWLCVEPVDFRKQITGLATLVQDAMAMDPFSTQLFVFTNRRRTQCRILYWERCGFVLWQKRLEGARFLKPEILAAIAEDTRRHATEWSLRFRECGIDPAIYLWDGSPCVFPGVRRHAGSREIAEFRRQSPQDTPPPHCLAIDDNDYPKHLWAFVFTGKSFRKKGPDCYQLGHLVDHKEHGNRWREELRVVGEDREPPLLFGLFTSAANTAYFPSAFLRPTDFSFHLRSLVQRRAQHLYSDVCLVLPPGLELQPGIHPSWEPERFQWNAPVGQPTHVPAFLEYRRRRIDELLRNRADALRSRSDAQNPDA